MVKMDKRVLVDRFEYLEYDGKDRYHQPAFKELVTVTNVRIDRNTVFSRDANEAKVLANAVIFCYADHTTPFQEFKEQSKIIFDGKEHILQRVIYVTNPYNNKPFAYELEVL